MRRCYSCFKLFEEEYGVCPYCGKPKHIEPKEPIHLIPGTVLQKRYLVGLAIDSGGFGIVYKAFDTKLQTVVAIKELFISRLVTRAEGLKNLIVSKKSKEEFEYRKERFLAEARTMARFGSHRSIPNVFEFFEENNTAYIVMEFLNGMTLQKYLQRNNDVIKTDFAIMVANEVGKALKSLHENGVIHRDVAPDNIFICTGKEIRLKLMDLGTAKLQDSTDDVIDIVCKVGYSPPEQYDNTKNIGPWTDIYALGATLYMMLTRVKPEESTNRKVKDNVVDANKINHSISENLNNTIMKSMAVENHMRFKTVDEFLLALNGEKKIIPLNLEKRKRKMKRFFGIVAACLVLLTVFGVVLNNYTKKQAEKFLKPATITAYVSDDDKLLFEECVNGFLKQEGKEKININIVSSSLDSYYEKLSQMFESGEHPTLFMSTKLDDGFLSQIAEPLDNMIIDSEEFKGCYYLKKHYNQFFFNHYKMPLCIDIPILLAPRKASSSDSVTLSEIYSIEDKTVYCDAFSKDLINQNSIEYNSECSFEEYKSFAKEDISKLYLFSSSENRYMCEKIVDEKPGLKIYNISDEMICNFSYEWSIVKRNGDNENEIKAAEAFIKYLLSRPDSDNMDVFSNRVTVLKNNEEENGIKIKIGG